MLGIGLGLVVPGGTRDFVEGFNRSMAMVSWGSLPEEQRSAIGYWRKPKPVSKDVALAEESRVLGAEEGEVEILKAQVKLCQEELGRVSSGLGQ